MIDRHLRDCDFCSAEIHLLKRHRAAAETTDVVEMPSHLRGLAENLFTRRTKIMRMSGFMVHSQLSH
jgi:hypothetical protein